MHSNSGIMGEATLQLFGPNGELKHEETKHNLITDAGDEYYAKMAIAGVQPEGNAAPSLATGMKLGTGSTAAAKTDAGCGTYITGSNNLFDTNYPTTENLGSTLGWNAIYRTTWSAGDVTNSAITEAVICTDAATDEDPLAAETISRVVFTAVNKGANDTLVITWKHKFLGAA